MLKKNLLILFIVFCILCISNICFAMDNVNDMKNAVGSGANTVIDGAANLATDVRNGVGHVENGIEDALTMGNMDRQATRDTTDNYTATRTATTANGAGGMSSTMWVWVIVAIAAIVIVGLVWYYGSQNKVD